MRIPVKLRETLEQSIAEGLVKSCVICRAVFVVKRMKSPCCSERCRKTYNQRNSRRDRIIECINGIPAHPR